MGTTRARLGRALVVVEAGLVTLSEAWGTAAGESTDGIDAPELAIVLPRGALVQVSAGPAVVLQQITPGAGAQEAAFRVSAEEGTWLRVLGALVHIWGRGMARVRSGTEGGCSGTGVPFPDSDHPKSMEHTELAPLSVKSKVLHGVGSLYLYIRPTIDGKYSSTKRSERAGFIP